VETIAVAFGGASHGGWRWAFILLGAPVMVVAILAFRLPEPPRGQWERKSVLGDLPLDDTRAPISIEMAFARLRQIRTMRHGAGARRRRFPALPDGVAHELLPAQQYGLDAFLAASSLR
jgi:MFS family permease